jgi:hypothetical protein
MRKTLMLAMAALAGQLLAGGFYLQLGNPEANPESKKANAAIVLKATGCHDPENAQITATAVGVVNGERQSIPLTVAKLSEPGTFAIGQQWPKSGKWVIEIVGRDGEMRTHALVAAGPDGVDRLHAKYDMKPFPKSAVEAMLD